MNARDLKAYADRSWDAVEALKREHWALEFATRGSEATLAASEALRRHMRLLHPEWPSDEERRDDLAQHLVLKRAIDRAAGAFVSLARR